MKITPLDIQQMVFRTGFRGYDKEEVNRFLEEIAETVEELNRENAIQREKIVFLEQQLTESKRTEATLTTMRRLWAGERVTHDILAWRLDSCVNGYRFPWHLVPVNQAGSRWPSRFPVVGAGRGPLGRREIHPMATLTRAHWSQRLSQRSRHRTRFASSVRLHPKPEVATVSFAYRRHCATA